jgi:predicted DNA-binding transcriptional regulator
LSKDRALGAAICAACVILAVGYAFTMFYPQWLSILNVQVTWLSNAQFWIIATPVLLAFLAVTVIGAWIGWTMTTTPPPKPIEDAVSETKESETKTEQKQPNSTG